MKKNASIALAALFTTVALSGTATANEQQPRKITADECVSHFIDVAFPSSPSIDTTVSFQEGALEKLVSDCEKFTNSESEFYKGMTKYRETRGNMTIEFK